MKTATKKKPAKKTKATKAKAVAEVAKPESVAETTKPLVEPHNWTDGGEKVLMLRRTDKDGKSYNNFQWPLSGTVECPDWNDQAECGNGLHAWPWGLGLGEGKDYDLIEDRWQVIAALPTNIVGELNGGWKCKCKTCEVIYSGPFAGAWALIRSGQLRLIQAMSKPGYSATNASAGDSAKNASAGYSATNASAGDSATNASAGDSATNASAGDSAKNASAGYYAKNASAGNYGSIDMAGKNSVAACAGEGTRIRGVNGCAFAIRFNDTKGNPRFATGVIGENGIKEKTWYEAKDGVVVEVIP